MIEINQKGDVAYIILGRAASRNALAVEDWSALRTTVENVAATSVRVIVLASSIEGAFCAGSDLRAMKALQHHPERVEDFRIRMRAAIDAVAHCSLPIVADIQGDCFGAGVALALACDMRVAGPRARFGITPAKLGISYPFQDIARLVRCVGAGQAGRLLLTADTLSAAQARDIGLVEILGEGSETERIASAIAGNSPLSVAAMKRLVHTVDNGGLDGADRMFDQFFSSADFAEGLKAFEEKRRPRFDGPGRR